MTANSAPANSKTTRTAPLVGPGNENLVGKHRETYYMKDLEAKTLFCFSEDCFANTGCQHIFTAMFASCQYIYHVHDLMFAPHDVNLHDVIPSVLDGHVLLSYEWTTLYFIIRRNTDTSRRRKFMTSQWRKMHFGKSVSLKPKAHTLPIMHFPPL